MARQPKPYKKGNYFCTSIGGIQHQKLCRIEEGPKTAREQLHRLSVKYADAPKTTKKHMVPTVGEAHDNFLDSKSVENCDGTYNFYRTSLLTFHEMFAGRPVKSLTYDDAIAYKKRLLADNLAANSINARIQAAKALLNWVCMPSRRHQYMCDINPFSELKRTAAKGRERVITDEEFEIVMAKMVEFGERHVKGGSQTSLEMFRLLRWTTMRPQELRHLRWEYIRWDEHRIVLPPSVVKTRNRREITMLDNVEAILKERRKRLKENGNDVGEGYVFFLPAKSPTSGNRRDANVCTGKILTASNLSCKWRQAVRGCMKAKTIDGKTDAGTLVPYSFRHTRITELVGEGHNLPVIMSEAGHLNPKTTMRYVHLQASQVGDQIRKADEEKRKAE